MGKDSLSSPRALCPGTLFVPAGRRPELRDLIAAPDEVLAVDLLDVGDDRLARLAHLHHPDPLRGDRLLVTAAHDDRAPRELHLESLAQHADDLVGVGGLRAPDGLRDDVGAGIAPRGTEFGLRVLHATRR